MSSKRPSKNLNLNQPLAEKVAKQTTMKQASGAETAASGDAEVVASQPSRQETTEFNHIFEWIEQILGRALELDVERFMFFLSKEFEATGSMPERELFRLKRHSYHQAMDLLELVEKIEAYEEASGDKSDD